MSGPVASAPLMDVFPKAYSWMTVAASDADPLMVCAPSTALACLNDAGPPPSLPPQRWGHTVAVVNNKVVVMGGYDSRYFNDVAVFDTGVVVGCLGGGRPCPLAARCPSPALCPSPSFPLQAATNGCGGRGWRVQPLRPAPTTLRL